MTIVQDAAAAAGQSAAERKQEALAARVFSRMDDFLRAMEFIENKSWYERHVTGIVFVMALTFGIAVGRFWYLLT